MDHDHGGSCHARPPAPGQNPEWGCGCREADAVAGRKPEGSDFSGGASGGVWWHGTRRQCIYSLPKWPTSRDQPQRQLAKEKKTPPPTRSLQDCLSLSKAADNQSSGINKTAVQLWGAGGQYGQPGQGRQEVLWGKNMKNWVFILEDGEQEFPYICLYQTLWKEQQLFNGERISVWRWERSGDGWWRWLPCEWM